MQDMRANAAGCVQLDGELPPGWTVDGCAGSSRRLHGPTRVGAAPELAVTLTRRPGATLENESTRLMTELARPTLDRVLTAVDVWPHPVWGTGRYIQTARLVDGIALAHDVYLFVDPAGVVVTVEVDCPLADLLAHEEHVAAVVAQLRPAPETAA